MTIIDLEDWCCLDDADEELQLRWQECRAELHREADLFYDSCIAKIASGQPEPTAIPPGMFSRFLITAVEHAERLRPAMHAQIDALMNETME